MKDGVKDKTLFSHIVAQRHNYAFDNLVAAELWGHIAATFSPEMIWNICNQISHACRAARDAERNKIFQAFVDGRLKKRKRNNRVTVEVIPAA